MISDDTLTLYYYRDGLDEEERAQLRDALANDPQLAERYRALSAELDALARPFEPAAPDEALIRWRHAVAAAAESEKKPSSRLPVALAAAAVLALGIAIGVFVDAPAPTVAPVVQVVEAPPPAVVRGVSQYLRDTQLQLAGLNDTQTDERVDMIGAVIEQNRLFERVADQQGAHDLARVLRAFEQQLVELANQEATPEQIDRTSDRLTFEYAVMLTRLQRDTSNSAGTL